MICGGTLKEGYEENGPGGSGHRRFQVADREVTLLDVLALALEQRPEVQALGAGGQGVRAGLLPELVVDQHVPGDHDRGAAHGRAVGPLPRRRRRGRRRGARRRDAVVESGAWVAAGPAVVPAAAGEPDALLSGRAPMPQEATEAARETAAAAARRRPRSLGVMVRMAPILRWQPSQHAQQAVENSPRYMKELFHDQSPDEPQPPAVRPAAVRGHRRRALRRSRGGRPRRTPRRNPGNRGHPGACDFREHRAGHGAVRTAPAACGGVLLHPRLRRRLGRHPRPRDHTVPAVLGPPGRRLPQPAGCSSGSPPSTRTSSTPNPPGSWTSTSRSSASPASSSTTPARNGSRPSTPSSPGSARSSASG